MSNVDLPLLDPARWDLVVPCGEGFTLELDVTGGSLAGFTFAASLHDVRTGTPVNLPVTVNGASLTVEFPTATTATLTPLGHGWRWRLVATPTAGGDAQTWSYGAVTLTRH